jgi:hypothetical protein
VNDEGSADGNRIFRASTMSPATSRKNKRMTFHPGMRIEEIAGVAGSPRLSISSSTSGSSDKSSE